MEKQSRLDEASEAKTKGDVVLAERIYHEILSKSAGTNESALRDQESALVQLGELYRDQAFVHPAYCIDESRQVDKLIELIKTSRTIMSNFAKAKTAKIGAPSPNLVMENGINSSPHINRLVLHHSKHNRNPNRSNKRLHLLGYCWKTYFYASIPPNSSRGPLP